MASATYKEARRAAREHRRMIRRTQRSNCTVGDVGLGIVNMPEFGVDMARLLVLVQNPHFSRGYCGYRAVGKLGLTILTINIGLSSLPTTGQARLLDKVELIITTLINFQVLPGVGGNDAPTVLGPQAPLPLVSGCTTSACSAKTSRPCPKHMV